MFVVACLIVGFRLLDEGGHGYDPWLSWKGEAASFTVVGRRGHTGGGGG